MSIDSVSNHREEGSPCGQGHPFIQMRKQASEVTKNEDEHLGS
jgi:hypothetical protein